MVRLILFVLISTMLGCDTSEKAEDSTTITTPAVPVAVYFPLSVVSPSVNHEVITNQNFTYSLSGGLPPYKFTYISGPGNIMENGQFVSGSISGTTTIDISDSATSAQTIRVKVKVYNQISINPTSALINVGESYNFTTTGGIPPYSYSLESGSGFINQLGLYSANLTPSSATIRVYDSKGNSATSQITVNRRIQLSPTNVTINRGESISFQASFGFPPYQYRVISGNGTINIDSGFFTSPQISGNTRIEASDSAGNTVYSDITISNQSLTLNQNQITMQVLKQFQFSAYGGLSPYRFQLWSPQNNSCSGNQGTLWTSLYCTQPNIFNPEDCYDQQFNWKYCSRSVGLDCDETNSMQLSEIGCYQNGIKNTIYTDEISCLSQGFKWFNGGLPEDFCQQILNGNPTSLTNSAGSFVAPLNPDEIRIRVKDGENNTSYAVANITQALTISPNNLTTTPSTVNVLSANGGVPPYSFRITSGIGTISNSNQNSVGEFVAPSQIGTTIIELSDSAGTIVSATITTSPALFISPISATISIGNSLAFIGSGGVPPYTFDIASGTGNITPSGIYTADSGTIFAPQSTVVRLTDSKGMVKLSNLIINPSLEFASSSYIFESGSSNVISVQNGVPPYQISLKNSSIYGSSIQNISNGSGGYTLKYNAGYVSDNVFETLVVIDALGNRAEQVVTIFGGLLAYLNPEQVLFSSTNESLAQNSILTNINSNLISFNKPNHGMIEKTTIRISNSSRCDNFETYEFNKRFDINLIDNDNFYITMDHKANNSLFCGSGIDFKFDTLGPSLDLCGSNDFSPLNLVNYSLSDISIKCQNNNSIFSGSCGKGANCTDQYRILINKNGLNANNLDFNLPNLNTTTNSISVEMWIKWDGTRNTSNPQINTFDGTLVGFDNYNASFMTVIDDLSIIRPSICFNTQVSQFDCFGTPNIDSLVKNKWTHIVLVFNNTDVNQSKIYINGIAQTLSKRGSVNSINRNTSNQFKIGANPNGNSPTFNFNSDIGQIRVYNKELVSNEVIQNYNQNKCLYQKICSN